MRAGFRTFAGLVALAWALCDPAFAGAATNAAGRLRVFVDDDLAPYSSRGADGQPVGFAVDVLRAAARAAGLEADLTTTHAGGIVAEFIKGEVDVALTSGGPPALDDALATAPYGRSEPVLYGRVGEKRRPAQLEAEGGRIAIVRSEVATAEAFRRGWMNMLPLSSGRIAFRLLARSEVAFVILDRQVALACLHNSHVRDVAPLEAMPELARDLRFFVHRDLPDVVTKLDAGLAAIRASGEYDRIRTEWFGFPAVRASVWAELRPYLPALALAVLLGIGLHFWRMEQRTRALRTNLRASEDQFRQITEYIEEVFWASAPDKSRMLYVSPAYERIWGRPCRELLANPVSWIDAVEPEDRERVRAAVATRQTEGTYDEVYRIRQPGGARRWIRDRAFPVRDATGAVVRLVGIAEDITAQQELLDRLEALKREQEQVVEQRTAELTAANAALLKSQERVQALLHAFPDMVFRMDRSGVFLDYSAPHVSLHVPADRIIGHNLRDMGFPAEMVRDALAANEEALESGRIVSFEYTLPVDGAPRHFEARVVRSGTDELVSTVRDVTDRREFEEKRRALEARLHESQKMESIGTLAGGIAHDFNNILGAILGYSELLAMDASTSAEARATLNEIAKAGRRGADMVRQILTFSRRQRHERRPLHLPPVLQESVRFLRASLPATIEIITDLAPDVASVSADPTQMQQVLMNLCTNAAHAMRDRPGRLEVALRNVEVGDAVGRPVAGLAPGRYVELSVSDSGVGIAERDLPRIFEPFFTTKRQGEGTGLGLSVVHGIITDHEGAITVSSRQQVGTTFRIFLPALSAAAETPVETEVVYAPGRAERVMFVDDEDAMTDMSTRLLVRMGYQVTSFTRPEEAIAVFMEGPHHFDVVVTDLNMPRLSGLDVARTVHATQPSMPIILVSGFLSGEAIPPSEESGIRETLSKPFTARQLSAALRRVLDETGRRPA